MTQKGRHSALAVPGAEFEVRATPRARVASCVLEGGVWRIAVNAPAEDGKANAAVAAALAHALGVAKGRLVLLRGATSRDKRFRLD